MGTNAMRVPPGFELDEPGVATLTPPSDIQLPEGFVLDTEEPIKEPEIPQADVAGAMGAAAIVNHPITTPEGFVVDEEPAPDEQSRSTGEIARDIGAEVIVGGAQVPANIAATLETIPQAAQGLSDFEQEHPIATAGIKSQFPQVAPLVKGAQILGKIGGKQLEFVGKASKDFWGKAGKTTEKAWVTEKGQKSDHPAWILAKSVAQTTPQLISDYITGRVGTLALPLTTSVITSSIEGNTAGAAQKRTVQETIENMPIDELVKLPVYTEALEETDGNIDKAREIAAKMAGNRAYGVTFITTAGTSLALDKIGAGTLDKWIQDPKVGQMTFKTLLKLGGMEATEEAVQSGFEQVIQNVSTGKPAMEGVFAAMGYGAGAGGILGAAVPGIGALAQNTNTGPVSPQIAPEAPIAPPPIPEGSQVVEPVTEPTEAPEAVVEDIVEEPIVVEEKPKKEEKPDAEVKFTGTDEEISTKRDEVSRNKQKAKRQKRSTSGVVDRALETFRDEFKKIKSPKKGDYQYREIVGSRGFQGDGAIPSGRLSPKSELTWEDALRRAKELNLVDQDASSPEALTPLFRGKIATIASVEQDMEARDVAAYERLLYNDMVDAIERGEKPPQAVIDEAPEIYDSVIRELDADENALTDVQEAFDTAEIEDDDFAFGANVEALELESVTMEDIREEQATRERKEKIKELAEKPLEGDAGDLTPDMFGEGETPLFDEVRATKEVEKDAKGTTQKVSKPSPKEGAKGKGSEQVRVRDTEQGGKPKEPSPGPKVQKKEPAPVKKKTEAQKALSPDEIEITDTGEIIDLTKKGEKRQKGGFVDLPSVKQVEKASKRIRKWISKKAGTTKGLTTELSDKVKKWQRGKNEKVILAKADKSAFKIARNELASKTMFNKEGKNKALQDLRDVLYGENTTEQLQEKYDLPEDNVVLKFLKDYNTRRKDASENIAALLKNRGAPEELIARIEADEFYVTRFYEKHILGEAFVPEQADYEAARLEIESGFQDVIEKLGQRATKAVGKRVNAPVVDYIVSGDATLLEGLSKTRQVELIAVRNAYQKVSQIVSAIDDSEGTIQFPIDPKALRDASESIIDYHLGKDSRTPGGPGSIDISSLRKRHLKGAFRALYGEITDPMISGARTTEVQGRTLEDLQFFEQMFREGQGKWWSEIPSQEKDHTVKLGGTSRSDAFKFGNLDGKYVSKELADILQPKKSENKALDFYLSTKSTMRLLKLFGPRTIVRNYVSALTGFSMGSGDMFRSGYGKNLKRGHTLLRDVLAQKPAALKELAELAGLDVFRSTNNSILNDVEFILSGRADTKFKQSLQWLGEKYAYIDFPTKVASYWTARDRGLSEKDAVEHVHRFYQNPDSVPEGLRDLSKLPLGDYPGYFFDSMRIAKNQVQNAVSSAIKGDPIPMMGFIISRGLQAAVWAGITKKLDDAWDRMWEKIKGKDPQVKKDKKLEKTHELALREFLPEYYRYGPLLASARTKNDGTKEIVFTINSNQFAFPFEDAMAGAVQSSGDDIGKGMKNLAKNIAQDRLKPGMLEEAAWKFFTGDAIDGSFRTKGISDLGAEDDDRNRIMLESGGNFLLDVFGGQFGDMFKQIYAIDQKKKGGLEPAGSYTSRKTVADVLKSKVAPWRTYKWDNNEMSRQIMFKLRPKAEEVSNKRAQIRKASSETAKPKDIAIARRARLRRIEMLKQMEGVVANARLLMPSVGMDEDELEAVVKDATRGLSADERDAVLEGGVSFLDEYEPDLRKSNRAKLYE